MLRSVPMPSIVTSTTIPGRIGSAPTDVPQAITSPGSRVISRDNRLMMRAGAMVGTPEQVRAKLETLSAEHGGVAEFAVITHCHDAEARRRSYTLLAEVFGMSATLPEAAE